MKYKLVMFDFDGTLADSLPWFMQVMNSVADKYNFNRVEAHEVDMLRGQSGRQIVKHLGVQWWKLPFIGRHMRQLVASQIGQISLFEGVDRMLQQLSDAGVAIALVTANSRENARRVLGPDNAARITYYECDVPMFRKRARFQRILKQSGVLPHEALCIGDELRDLEAAMKAGIPFGAVTWGFTHGETLAAQAPAQLFTRVDQITERILEPVHVSAV